MLGVICLLKGLSMDSREIVESPEGVAKKINENGHLWECYDCGHRWKGSPPWYRPICPCCDSEEVREIHEYFNEKNSIK